MICYPQSPDIFLKMTPAEIVRYLIMSRSLGTLSSTLAEDGSPYGALVLLAAGHDGRLVMLLSDLAEHTKNFKSDPRVSILLNGTDGLASPLTGPRATLVGTIEKTEDPHLKARFMARHPDASVYKDFKDFSFYTLNAERAHLVAGFGQIEWLDAAAFAGTAYDALIDAENSIIEHMNMDHRDALRSMAAEFGEVPGAEVEGTWIMSGIDSNGFDLNLDDRVVRIAFHNPVVDAESARQELVRLTKRARSIDSGAD